MTLPRPVLRNVRTLIVSSILLGGLVGVAGCAPAVSPPDASPASSAAATTSGGQPTASPSPSLAASGIEGDWKLTSFSIVSPEFSLAYTPISGTAEVQITRDGQATLTMDTVLTTVATGIDIPATELVGTGKVDAKIEADPELTSLQWTSDPASIGLTMTVDGQVIEGGEFGEDTRFEPMADMRLEIDGSRMLWIYDVEGGTGQWEWHR